MCESEFQHNNAPRPLPRCQPGGGRQRSVRLPCQGRRGRGIPLDARTSPDKTVLAPPTILLPAPSHHASLAQRETPAAFKHSTVQGSAGATPVWQGPAPGTLVVPLCLCLLGPSPAGPGSIALEPISQRHWGLSPVPHRVQLGEVESEGRSNGRREGGKSQRCLFRQLLYGLLTHSANGGES